MNCGYGVSWVGSGRTSVVGGFRRIVDTFGFVHPTGHVVKFTPDSVVLSVRVWGCWVAWGGGGGGGGGGGMMACVAVRPLDDVCPVPCGDTNYVLAACLWCVRRRVCRQIPASTLKRILGTKGQSTIVSAFHSTHSLDRSRAAAQKIAHKIKMRLRQRSEMHLFQEAQQQEGHGDGGTRASDRQSGSGSGSTRGEAAPATPTATEATAATAATIASPASVGVTLDAGGTSREASSAAQDVTLSTVLDTLVQASHSAGSQPDGSTAVSAAASPSEAAS